MKKRVPKDRKLNSDEIKGITGEINKISEIIKLARQKLNWTQEELSFRSDVSTRTISRLENSKTNPRQRTITKILDAVGFPVTELYWKLPEWFVQHEDFSETLRFCRKHYGWTQKDMAAQSGLSLRTIKYFENGRYNARLSSLSKLERVIGLPNGMLFFFLDKKVQLASWFESYILHKIVSVVSKIRTPERLLTAHVQGLALAML